MLSSFLFLIFELSLVSFSFYPNVEFHQALTIFISKIPIFCKINAMIYWSLEEAHLLKSIIFQLPKQTRNKEMETLFL